MTRFDLTEARNLRVARRTQRFHGLLRGLFAFGIVAIGAWVTDLAIRNGWTATSAVVVGSEVAASILFGWIVIMTRPGAEVLEVSEAGVELGFAGGRIWRRGWNDDRFRLNVFQSRNSSEDRATVQLIQLGSGVWPVTNFLTVPAFDALLGGARQHGLSVLASSVSRQGGTWYRIAPRLP